MSDIGWIVTYDGRSGGTWVRERVVEGLAGTHDVREVKTNPGLAPRRFASAAWQLATHDDPSVDVWVEDQASLALRAPTRRRNNVLVLHHLSEGRSFGSLADVAATLQRELVLRRLREVDRIVVVSDFWEEWLADRGFDDRVEKIYNGLPVDRFDLDPDTVRAVRERLCEDPEKPLIHVGTCAPEKGGDRAYHALADRDATLITTGRKVDDTPVDHYNPSYDEYLRILAACDVLVAMSQCPEGWGLQVQEAMLCRTPVVGTPRGGMEMLLREGGQVVCPDFDALDGAVSEALADGERIGEAGYEYASQFTLERMLDGWRRLFDEMTPGHR